MSNLVQLDLFQDTDLDNVKQVYTKINELEKVCSETKESSDKVRKGIFARHNELAKMYMDAHNRLEILERHICRS